MRRLALRSYAIAVVLVIGISGPALARGRKKPTPPPTPAPPTIAAVTPSSLTISKAGTARTFTISQFTEIYVNGQKATVADLKPGMRVTVTAGLDRTQAARIEASGAPKKKKKSGG